MSGPKILIFIGRKYLDILSPFGKSELYSRIEALSLEMLDCSQSDWTTSGFS